MSTEETAPKSDFIRDIARADLASGRHSQVVTRFPPEPNGHLHVGHAKAICLDFGLPLELGGECHLRFDDTNPETEEAHFVEAIRRDVQWLGFDWGEHEYHASDYFAQFYEWAVHLVKEGQAYVCDLSDLDIRAYRGTVTEAGRPSPFRDRSPAESLDLLGRMKAGEFPDGSRTLRAKIDMASPNMKMRDPLIYRIRHATHHRTGAAWCIYPMYDFAHCLSDAIEGVTHSLCTLEFENNRELYDWFIDNCPVPSKPRQIEFARLALSHTVLSKRRLAQLVEEGHVNGWDDPRMPTISGMRRRGYPAEALRTFCDRIGVAKRDNVVALAQLEHAVREWLNLHARRVMVVMDPIKVVLENYPEGKTEDVTCLNNPENEADGTRAVPFSRELWIERDDFMEDAPRKFFRLAPGREVRLKHAYFITCTDVVKDAEGRVTELRCTYDPESAGGSAPDGRSPKGTLHWVSAAHGQECEIRLYDTLFTDETPGKAKADTDFAKTINPESLTVLKGCVAEPGLGESAAFAFFQFMRQGYFVRDCEEEGLVFNRTVGLRDSWARLKDQAKG